MVLLLVCAAVDPIGAFFIGGISGVVVVFSIEIIDKVFKIDDPVGASSVHGVVGAVGTLLVGFFAVDGGLFYGGGFGQLAIQAVGVLSVGAWAIGTAFVTFKLVDLVLGLRVSEAEEIAGLDIEEHGSTAYADFEMKSFSVK